MLMLDLLIIHFPTATTWELSTKMYFAEIGEGWKVAVIETQEEYDFIREGQKGFSSSVPYWIGGSTDVLINNTFDYYDYIANGTGSFSIR